jgi:CRP/FNR family transcriptional regulator, anaerobic regulatory protein
MPNTLAMPRSIPVMPLASRSATVVRLVPQANGATACSSCCLKGVCLPCDLGGLELNRFDQIATARRRVARGASLYHGGDGFESLYAVRSGAFKTVCVSRQGDEKVTGFHLPGELLGLEAISSGRHGYSAVALEDSDVCVLPFVSLEKMALAVPALQHQLLRLVSGDISRDQGLMLLLGSMSAEQRLAAFLLSLSRRHKRLGYSADRFVLRMTREEIGNYLGLTLETVSRLFSRFHREGLIAVQQRDVELKSADQLMEMVGHW